MFFWTFAAFGCNEADVVLYVSADEHIARQVIDAFEKESGLRVLMVGDTEAKKTTALAERLKAEADRPQADVFWSSEVFMTIELAEQGVLEEYASPATDEFAKAYRDPERRWHGFAARPRVIVYAPNRVADEHVPQSWMDLTNDRFRGRIVMADPRFGTTGGHLGAMAAYWDRKVMPGYYRAFLEGLAENQIRLLPSGNAGVVEAVASGEADIGMTDADDVWAAQARGLDVDLVYPLHNVESSETGAGTLLIPNTVALVKGAPHRKAAAKLIDFLLSEKVERMLAESVSHNIPLRQSLSGAYPQYAVPDPLLVDLRLAAQMRSKAIDLAMKVLASPGSQGQAESQPNASQEPDQAPDAR